MRKSNLTYQKSGVNIKAADKFVNFISSTLNKSNKSVKFMNIGGFGSVSPIPKELKGGYLVASTDGVGTKLEIANDLKKFGTIGIDLVAMSVNDLIVQGAKPLLFLDYISIGKINQKKLKDIILGIINGCKTAGCKLAGGETAEMPGTYTKDKFDLAGFAVGIVEKKKLLKKNNIKNGNIILAIPSNGVHSNGYSLIRNILKKKKILIKNNNFLKKELLKPTKIYVKEILNLIDNNLINGCAHITGGGLADNLKRIIPKNCTADINLSNIKTQNIFKWIKKSGVSDKEMLKTFNCGIGFCIITKKNRIGKIKKQFSKRYQPYEIGRVINGKKSIKFNEKIHWD